MKKICSHCTYRKFARYSRDDSDGCYFCYNHNSPVNKGNTMGVTSVNYDRPACDLFKPREYWEGE